MGSLENVVKLERRILGVSHHDEPQDALVVVMVMVMGGRGRKHSLPITRSTLLIAAGDGSGDTAASDGSVYAVRGRHRGGGCRERAKNRGGLYVGGEIRRNHLPLKLCKG